MPQAYEESFDSIYSISDIHLGGRGDFQIFNNGPRLAAFIDRLSTTDLGQKVALVLNGDVIDSLAEDDIEYVALTEAQAESMMNRILDDPAFAPVWQALANFVAVATRHLVFVAGNHDIELDLPIVQRILRNHLTGGSHAANARITFATRGAGYRCYVGEARVFFSHGNELDAANRVDNEKLAQLGLAQNAGRTVEPSEWRPNVGTRLVVDVMNDVKREYPFVDLLKPQGGSAFAVLMMLGRGSIDYLEWSDLRGGLTSVVRSRQAGGRLLNLDPIDDLTQMDDPELGPEVELVDLLGPRTRRLVLGSDRDASEDSMLLDADRLVSDAGVDRYSASGVNVSGEDFAESPETLGQKWDAVRTFGKGLFRSLSDKQEALRMALLDMKDQEERFGVDAIHDDDRMSRWLRERHVDAHFVIAGHSHKARSIPIVPSRTAYLNSGTWIRLLSIGDEALTEANFESLWDALTTGSMAALDDAEIDVDGVPTPLLTDFVTAVRLRSDPLGAIGDLLQIAPDGSFDPVPDSAQLVRV